MCTQIPANSVCHMTSLLSQRSGTQLKEYLQQLCSLLFEQFDTDAINKPEADEVINKFLHDPASPVIYVSQLVSDHKGTLSHSFVNTEVSYRLSSWPEYKADTTSTLAVMKNHCSNGSESVAAQLQVLHLRAEGDYYRPLHTLLEHSLLPLVESRCPDGSGKTYA